MGVGVRVPLHFPRHHRLHCPGDVVGSQRVLTRRELLSHGPEGLGPTTLSGVIEAKQQALRSLREQLEGRPASDVPMLSTYAQLERSATLAARGLGPEGELKSAYKVMKAGI